MTKNSLFPVPKVLLPFAVGCIGLLVRYITTGELNREEIGALVGIGLYAGIGYSLPAKYEDVPVVGKRIKKS